MIIQQCGPREYEVAQDSQTFLFPKEPRKDTKKTVSASFFDCNGKKSHTNPSGSSTEGLGQSRA